MKPFYAVIYDPDGKNKTRIIPGRWILPQKDNIMFGERKFIFHHNDLDIQLPFNQNQLRALIKYESKVKENGYLYPGIVLQGFGKYLN